MSDVFYTIEKEGEAQYKEKMSRFLAFARKVKNAETAKAILKNFQNDYHDARHVCWAYMLGPDRKEWQLNDNGEPSGTAGKPILGQINSKELTDVLVVVVRYFGGIKLGTPGLIAAYREAARLALEDSGRVELHDMETITVTFPYMAADGVMRIVKSGEVEVIDRIFDNTCSITLSFRKDKAAEIKGKLLALDGVTLGE